MTLLFENEILVFEAPPQRLRLLWLHIGNWFVIDIDDKKAFPHVKSHKELQETLDSGQARKLAVDPLLRLSDEKTPASHITARDQAYESISSLVTQRPAIFNPHARSKLVKALAKAKAIEKAADIEKTQGISKIKGTSKTTIYTNLRRFWQGGQTKNACLPHYENCGGKGKERRWDGAKRGTKRTKTAGIGDNVSPDTRMLFAAAVDQFYADNTSFTIAGCFREMLSRFFVKRVINKETGSVEHLQPTDKDGKEVEDPTFSQFDYWFRKEHDRLEMRRRRVGATNYAKNLRGFIDTANSQAWGPGAQYQIDATIADVYLVSRADRTRIVGRPTLYVVIDTFSRLVVGVYASLESASWIGAMMALANAFSDKVEYCKQAGVEIEPHEWPCQHVCAAVLADGAEVKSAASDSLTKNFNVDVYNTAPYRADWKSVVEVRFRLLQARFAPYVPGYVKPDFRERGAEDYRLDATLDIEQFTQIIIRCILEHNNNRELVTYDKSAAMIEDGVPPIPVEMWEWGIANMSGALRAFPPDKVRFAVMPTDKVSVQAEGLYFRGNYYSCDIALKEGWFDHARQGNARNGLKASYDPRLMDHIYLHQEGALNYVVCELTERSRGVRGLSDVEIQQIRHEEKMAASKRQTKHKLAGAKTTDSINAIVALAQGMRPDMDHMTKAQRVADIRDNRAAEKQDIRRTEAFRPEGSAPTGTPSEGAKVIDFPSPTPEEEDEDYDLPSITQIRKGPQNG